MILAILIQSSKSLNDKKIEIRKRGIKSIINGRLSLTLFSLFVKMDPMFL